MYIKKAKEQHQKIPSMKSIQKRDCDLLIEDKPVEPPYPIRLPYQEVKVGFGRGSSDLNCPTANIDIPKDNDDLNKNLPTGVYFGFCKLRPNSHNLDSCKQKRVQNDNSEVEINKGIYLKEECKIDLKLPCVLSIGYNITYDDNKIKSRSLEVHVLEKFEHKFYGAEMQLTILGYIRPEIKYNSLDELIDGIETDKLVATEVLTWDSFKDI